jgi:hypothetical protein
MGGVRFGWRRRSFIPIEHFPLKQLLLERQKMRQSKFPRGARFDLDKIRPGFSGASEEKEPLSLARDARAGMKAGLKD